MYYGCDMNQLPHCCGFYEAGHFREGPNKLVTDLCGSSPEELLEEILDFTHGRPIIFNFVQFAFWPDPDGDIDIDIDYGLHNGEFEEVYEMEYLHKLVQAHPKVIDIGTHINPGTKNRIHSLIIKDYLQ